MVPISAGVSKKFSMDQDKDRGKAYYKGKEICSIIFLFVRVTHALTYTFVSFVISLTILSRNVQTCLIVNDWIQVTYPVK